MAQPNDETAANKALVIRYMTASQSNDSATMAQCLDENCERMFPRPGLHNNPMTKGSANIIAMLPHRSHYETGSLKMEVENILAEGPLVAVQFLIRAKTAGGAPYENFYHFLFECKNGRITKFWEYCDTLYGAQMLRPQAVKDVAASLG